MPNVYKIINIQLLNVWLCKFFKFYIFCLFWCFAAPPSCSGVDGQITDDDVFMVSDTLMYSSGSGEGVNGWLRPIGVWKFFPTQYSVFKAVEVMLQMQV